RSSATAHRARAPRRHRPAAELLAAVGADRLWQAANDAQAIQHARHADTGDGSSDFDAHRLMRGVIDDGQALGDAGVGGTIEHEIYRPHFVGFIMRAVGPPRPKARSFGAHRPLRWPEHSRSPA